MEVSVIIVYIDYISWAIISVVTRCNVDWIVKSPTHTHYFVMLILTTSSS